MASTAVGSVPSRGLPLPAHPGADSEPELQLRSLSRQMRYGRKLRPNRTGLVLLGVVVVGIWVVLGFANTITQLNAASDRQAVLTTETKALTNRLDAGHRELELVQTDAFQALQARGFGIGAPGEVAFSLPTDTPALRVVPLGSEGSAAAPKSPLDAWLRLLFGD
jgi:hypothetical protein